MAELLIRDEAIARRLLNLAEQQNRSVEAVLDDLLNLLAAPPAAQTNAPEDWRTRKYARARRYWQSVGDQERLALTDEALDEQFWLFDGDNIPRLKADQATIQVEPTALQRFAEGMTAAQPDLTSLPTDDFDAFLNEEYGEYVWQRFQRGLNDTSENSGG